jgi:hypothetical protein
MIHLVCERFLIFLNFNHHTRTEFLKSEQLHNSNGIHIHSAFKNEKAEALMCPRHRLKEKAALLKRWLFGTYQGTVGPRTLPTVWTSSHSAFTGVRHANAANSSIDSYNRR